MDQAFLAGYARVDANPAYGTPVSGYYIERKVEGVLDNLQVVAVYLKYKEENALIISVDHCGLTKSDVANAMKEITDILDIKEQSIFIHSTHTHTAAGPSLTYGENDELYIEYKKDLFKKIALCAVLSYQDLKPAKMGYAVGEAKRVAFVRRFRMKDGSIQTNPGVNNPNILAPIGDVDERVNVLRIDRENAPTIVLANFGNHPDTVGGSKISADWPGFTRKFVEQAIENTKCIFINGAQGDVNHVNVHPTKGDFNDMFNDFDGCSRGYGHARHIGRVVAGAVMQVYDKVNYVDVDCLKSVKKLVKIPAHKATEEQLVTARKYDELHRADKDDQIPFKGMMLTTVVAEAERMLRLENGPDYFELTMSGIRIGNAYLIGFPGEPFTGIGRATKEILDGAFILPCCTVNDCAGYFPTKDAYDEGGYESRASDFAPSVAEKIYSSAKEVVEELNK